MNKTILKSNSAFVMSSEFPAWTTGEQEAYLFPLMQGSQISMSAQRQSLKQVGSSDYAVDDIMRAPDVNLQLSYYSSPYWVNEYLMGMNVGFEEFLPVFSGDKNKNQNYYLIIDEKSANDGFDEFRKPSGRNLSGVSSVSVGNCFLKSYSVSYAVGSVPVAGATFAGSNIKLELPTGESIKIPAVDLASGNSEGAGDLNLNKIKVFLTGKPEIEDITGEYYLPVVSPQETQVFLQDLQVGGISLSGSNPLIQSVSLDLEIERQDLYGLGSNHVYGRKIQYPIRGSVKIDAFVSGMASGDLSNVFKSETGYSIELEIKDPKFSAATFLKIENAKLNSYSIGMAINDNMSFNAEYSFAISETGGLFAKTVTPIPDKGFVFVFVPTGSQVFTHNDAVVQVPSQFANSN